MLKGSKRDYLTLVVCGNKSDIKSQANGESLAKKYKGTHYVTSCKSGAGVDEMFDQVAL